jgi:hypothetical protein
VIKIIIAVSLGLVLTSVTTIANATSYNFDVTFDGSNATVDGSSDAIAGTNLVPGDFFSLDIHAAGNDYWFVNTTTSTSFNIVLEVDSGARIANVTTTLFLDGAQVSQDIELNVGQSSVHVGNQDFDFISGTMFDQVVVDWTFLSQTSGVSTVIQDNTDILRPGAFFRQPYVTYVESSVVPLPASFPLFASGLGALGLLGWRRKRKKVAAIAA